jgi:hypothetical protein
MSARSIPDRAWVFADAWVLAAIGGYDRPCSLPEVIAAADWINHAILLAGEVETALSRLTGAGLVRVLDDWTFELTDDGTEVWSEGAGHDLLGRVMALEAQLSAFEPGATTVRLPPGAMERAVEDYLSRPGT